MLDGWIKINRKITEMQGYFGERFSRVQCWIDLLLLAEWRPQRIFYIRGNRVVVNRGQIAISETELAKRWSMNRRTVRVRLAEFVSDEKITQQKSNIINLITICKYEQYQQANSANCTTDCTTDCTTSKNIKNNKNISNNERAYACEGKFISELKNDESWCELMRMRHKVSKDDLMQWIDDFDLDAECRGKVHNNLSDAKQHFNDWLRIQLKIKQDENNREKSKVQRKGFEGTVSKAENYTTTF